MVTRYDEQRMRTVDLFNSNTSRDNLQNVYVNINRVIVSGNRLIESGHYATGPVQQVASMLDRAWKEFASWLEERTAVLALSVMFHQKAQA